jgi:hypothetical protein
VAACSECGAQLCLACAVPVRGQTVGPECLGKVLEDRAPAAPPPAPAVPRTDLVAAAGFALVVALSILPWAEFGDTSGLFQAWTPHWSLAAVGGALIGLVAAIATWRHPRDPRLEVALQLGLAIVVGLAALLHYRRPPPLSAASPTPIFAMLAAVLPAISGALKAVAIIRVRRPSVPR